MAEKTQDKGTGSDNQPSKHISAKVRFLASNMASVISVTTCFPLEVLKTRLQIQVRTSLLTQKGLIGL